MLAGVLKASRSTPKISDDAFVAIDQSRSIDANFTRRIGPGRFHRDTRRRGGWKSEERERDVKRHATLTSLSEGSQVRHLAVGKSFAMYICIHQRVALGQVESCGAATT